MAASTHPGARVVTSTLSVRLEMPALRRPLADETTTVCVHPALADDRQLHDDAGAPHVSMRLIDRKQSWLSARFPPETASGGATWRLGRASTKSCTCRGRILQRMIASVLRDG
jgi:hypothetical protein